MVCGGVASVPADITLAGGLSHYGTMGQAGNVYEWNESAITAPNDVTSENRALRGGAWGNTIYSLSSSFLYLLSGPPDYSASGIGFRVASVVPEPSSARLMFSASLLALAWRRRRAAL